MGELLSFFSDNKSGIYILLLCLLSFIIFIQWLSWIFCLGRFNSERSKNSDQTLRYVFAELFVNIINDFKNFVAIVILAIFAFTLVVTFFVSKGEISPSFQSVISIISGLVGTVLGFYFGTKEKGGSRLPSELKDTLIDDFSVEDENIQPDEIMQTDPPIFPKEDKPIKKD